ncbi:MAG: GNAT family N-acetyltransferase [Gammaproteobacteria bacterium]
MNYHVVTTTEEWRGLREEWTELLSESRANTIFLSWEWLESWIQVQVTAPSLFVICVRDDDGTLLAAAPLYQVEYRLLKFLPYTILHVLGDTDSGAEYQTWIARESHEQAALTEIVSALKELNSRWDLIWMPKLENWTNSVAPIVDALQAGGFAVNTREAEFSAVALPESFDEFLSQMSSNRRRQLNKNIRTVFSSETVHIQKVVSEADLDAALESLFELHAKRWELAGEPGSFADYPQKQAFYREFAREALRKGWLALYVLYDDGVAKAIQFGYVYGSAFLQLQEGFEPDYLPGVGNALRARVIEELIELGVRDYDFLGGVSEHKRRWRAETRHGIDLLGIGRGLKNLLVLKAGIWPPGKYLERISG